MYYIQHCFFFHFRWRCWWRVGEVVVNQTNYQGYQFDVDFIKCQTCTEIWESWLNLSNMFKTISNIYTYPFNPQLKKKKLKVMIRNQKIKGTIICGPLFFKWMEVFESWLDCLSIGVWGFVKNINFFIFSVLRMLVSIWYNF